MSRDPKQDWKPMAVELFAGLSGWGEGLAAEGFFVVGFDLYDITKGNDMRMNQCDSTLIHSYGYDPATLQLDIEFHKGGRYRYSGVTQERFEDFLRSTSKGKHFLAEIKGKYEFQKI